MAVNLHDQYGEIGHINAVLIDDFTRSITKPHILAYYLLYYYNEFVDFVDFKIKLFNNAISELWMLFFLDYYNFVI